VFKNNDSELTYLTLESKKGSSELITTTPEHPFYVSSSKIVGPQQGNLGKNWVGAGHLEIGDKIHTADGSSGIVLSVVNVVQARVMYNLEVAGNHDFFVGSSGWLVHNSEGEPCKILWTNHGFKHVPQKSIEWPEIIKSTKKGPAKYTHGTDIEKLERSVWDNGTPVTNGKPWKVMEFNSTIGASEGSEVRWMRVEYSGNTIHGHPITESEYKKLLKQR
jgi:hypothetical protein